MISQNDERDGRYMRLKSWKTVSITVVLLFSELNAYIIENKNATPDKLYIQVGALKQQQSVEQLRKRLRRFPLWIHREGEMIKVFVVSNPRYKKAMLRKVHRLVPDAFVVNRSKKHSVLESVPTVPYSSKSHQNSENATLPLDTQTILQTRKKFF